jgi:hypothetical protein
MKAECGPTRALGAKRSSYSMVAFEKGRALCFQDKLQFMIPLFLVPGNLCQCARGVRPMAS